MEQTLVVKDQHFPLVVIELAGKLKSEDNAIYQAKFNDYFARQLKTVVIIDLRQSVLVPGREQLSATGWIRKNDKQVGQYILGVGFVISNPFIEAALKTILMFQPINSEMKTFRQPEDALPWAAEIAAKGGLALAPIAPQALFAPAKA